MSVTQLPVHRRATTIAQTPALAALAGGGNVSAHAGDRAHEAWNAHIYGTSGHPHVGNRSRLLWTHGDGQGRFGPSLTPIGLRTKLDPDEKDMNVGKATAQSVAAAVAIVVLVTVGASGAGATERSSRAAVSAPKWDPVVRYVRFVERHRKLEFDYPVPVKFLADAAFVKAYQRDDPKITKRDRADADRIRRPIPRSRTHRGSGRPDPVVAATSVRPPPSGSTTRRRRRSTSVGPMSTTSTCGSPSSTSSPTHSRTSTST